MYIALSQEEVEKVIREFVEDNVNGYVDQIQWSFGVGNFVRVEVKESE